MDETRPTGNVEHSSILECLGVHNRPGPGVPVGQQMREVIEDRRSPYWALGEPGLLIQARDIVGVDVDRATGSLPNVCRVPAVFRMVVGQDLRLDVSEPRTALGEKSEQQAPVARKPRVDQRVLSTFGEQIETDIGRAEAKNIRDRLFHPELA